MDRVSPVVLAARGSGAGPWAQDAPPGRGRGADSVVRRLVSAGSLLLPTSPRATVLCVTPSPCLRPLPGGPSRHGD